MVDNMPTTTKPSDLTAAEWDGLNLLDGKCPNHQIVVRRNDERQWIHTSDANGKGTRSQQTNRSGKVHLVVTPNGRIQMELQDSHISRCGDMILTFENRIVTCSSAYVLSENNLTWVFAFERVSVVRSTT